MLLAWPPVSSGYLFSGSAVGGLLPFLKSLINQADEMLLCAGWIKAAALRELHNELGDAVARRANVTLVSNSAHTNKDSIRLLKKMGVKHVIVDKSKCYFHTKLYFFQSKGRYCAVVGSANLTEGAFNKNEELSRYVCGLIGDAEHQQLVPYLRHLALEYGTPMLEGVSRVDNCPAQLTSSKVKRDA